MHDKLELIKKFTSEYGRVFYDLPQTTEHIQLVKESFTIPNQYFGIVPMYAGMNLHWSAKHL